MTRKYYQYNNSGKLPTLVYRTQPEYLKTPEGDKSTKAQIIYMFENTTPYDFLKIKNKGVEPSARDLRIIETLMDEYRLTPAVINVLIDYVLRKNNNKLNKDYIETIAIQWRRSNITTASDAMDIARKENNKITKKLEKTSNKKIKTDVPAWFSVEQNKEEMSEEEIKELEELLKDYRQFLQLCVILYIDCYNEIVWPVLKENATEEDYVQYNREYNQAKQKLMSCPIKKEEVVKRSDYIKPGNEDYYKMNTLC